MTEISFHTNLPDRLGYACRLLRKAVRRHACVVVTGPGRVLAELDRQLWVFDPLEFVPHVFVPDVRAESARTVAPHLHNTPVWLTEVPTQAPHREVLVHVGDEALTGFEDFARLIELVPDDGPGLQAGRARWRQYTEQGFTLQKHDMAGERAA